MADLYTQFPDDFASNQEKEDRSYGEQVAKAMESEWYNGLLGLRRTWINRMRNYSKGEQTTNYQAMIEGDKKNKDNSIKTKTHKIDYSEKLKVLPVFKDISINAIDESLFKPRAEAIDITAVNEKKNYFKKLDEDFYTQDFAKIISEGLGVNIGTPNLPKNQKELNIRKIEYKPRIEIAQELAIENVLKHQKFEAIKDKCDEDLFDLGFCVVRHYTDKSEGIKIKYVDPYNYIHNSFEIDDGRDIRYHGVIQQGTIGELMKESDSLTGDELNKIYNYALGNPDGTEKFDYSEDSDRLLEYISFSYLIPESRIFKKRNKYKYTKLIDRTQDGFKNGKQNKKLEIPYLVWYEGIYVPQAQVIVKWEKIPNQIENSINEPISPFLIYAPKVKRNSETGNIRFDSQVQRAIPIVDDLQRDWYKFQQLKMELRPNTVTISPRALNNVRLNGQKIAPQDVLDMYFGRGILLADEFDEDGEPIGKAIREEGGGINNSALTFLSNEFANNYNRLRQILGINELRDGTTQPNSKTAVTVQKLLLASSNNATNHLVKASFNISLRVAESISLRLYDVLSTTALRERYMNIIGSSNVELLDVIKKLPMHKFGIYFDFKPDNEERIAFEQSLVNSYSQKEINVAQYNKARQIRNVKSAIKYLEHVINENIDKAQKQKIENIQQQAEANARTSVLTEQTKQQSTTIKYETDKNLKLLDYQLQDESERKRALTEDILAERQHGRKMREIQLQNKGDLAKKQEEIEGRKELVNLNSTNISKQIEQRQKNSEPIDFTKNSDTDIFQQELNQIFNKSELLTDGQDETNN